MLTISVRLRSHWSARIDRLGVRDAHELNLTKGGTNDDSLQEGPESRIRGDRRLHRAPVSSKPALRRRSTRLSPACPRICRYDDSTAPGPSPPVAHETLRPLSSPNPFGRPCLPANRHG